MEIEVSVSENYTCDVKAVIIHLQCKVYSLLAQISKYVYDPKQYQGKQ